MKMHLDKAVGNFASGSQMYIFKVAGSESFYQGDINHDKRIDENDLTSYMNYTGLRKGDSATQTTRWLASWCSHLTRRPSPQATWLR